MWCGGESAGTGELGYGGQGTEAALQLHTKEGEEEGKPRGLYNPSSHQGSALSLL